MREGRGIGIKFGGGPTESEGKQEMQEIDRGKSSKLGSNRREGFRIVWVLIEYLSLCTKCGKVQICKGRSRNLISTTSVLS